MRLLGPAASCEHNYVGHTNIDPTWKSETAEEFLGYLKTYNNEVTGRCATLAASPRVQDADPAREAFSRRCRLSAQAVSAENFGFVQPFTLIRFICVTLFDLSLRSLVLH